MFFLVFFNGFLNIHIFVSLGQLGPSWDALGGVLERSWGVLGPLGAILGASWGVLEGSWGVLEASWGVLGRSWGDLGRPRDLFRIPRLRVGGRGVGPTRYYLR